MGWLDRLLGRAKGATQRGPDTGGAGGGREGARMTEPGRTSAEGTRPTEPAGQEQRPSSRPEGGPGAGSQGT